MRSRRGYQPDGEKAVEIVLSKEAEVPQRLPFKYTPSVGSWLQKAPKSTGESASILDRRPSELEKMDKQELIAAFRVEVEKRDRHIESLKCP